MRRKEKDIWEAYSSTYDSYLEASSREYVWRSKKQHGQQGYARAPSALITKRIYLRNKFKALTFKIRCISLSLQEVRFDSWKEALGFSRA